MHGRIFRCERLDDKNRREDHRNHEQTEPTDGKLSVVPGVGIRARDVRFFRFHRRRRRPFVVVLLLSLLLLSSSLLLLLLSSRRPVGVLFGINIIIIIIKIIIIRIVVRLPSLPGHRPRRRFAPPHFGQPRRRRRRPRGSSAAALSGGGHRPFCVFLLHIYIFFFFLEFSFNFSLGF